MRFAACSLVMAVSAFAEYANLDGQRVYYEAAGKGEPAVVFIHGWTCDGTFWNAQKDAVAKKHRILVVDLPGHGRSDKPVREYDLPLFARGVRAAMDAAKIRRAVLVGHSMGTPVAREFHRNQPDRVLAIVSVDAPVFRNPPESLVKSLSERGASMRGTAGLEVRRKFIESMYAQATTPEMRKRISSAMLAAPDFVAASAMANLLQSPLWNDSSPLNVPVLAINKANKDPRIRQTHEQVFANLEYHELDNVSHFLQMEAPDRVNPILLAFLAKVGK